MKPLLNFKNIFVITVFAVAAHGQYAFSQNTSPYLRLYQAKSKADKLETEVARISLNNEKKSLERLRPLVSRGVISRQQFEEQQIKVDIAKLEVDNLEAVSSQSDSLLYVNKLRIENGLEVPICPEGE